MATDKQNFAPFLYAPESPEALAFRRLLMGAILEFGAPHAFESGAMTRPVAHKNSQATTPQTHSLDYSMLQEEGAGFTIFGALRAVYDAPTIPIEPVRFAVQFVTTQGTAVVDISMPSRDAAHPSNPKTFDESIGPRIRVGLVSAVKKARLPDILMDFSQNKNNEPQTFAPLLKVMREVGETKKPAVLQPSHLKLLADFITGYFGDFSHIVPPDQPPTFEEIIPETPNEVARSDHWVASVARAAQQARQPNKSD